MIVYLYRDLDRNYVFLATSYEHICEPECEHAGRKMQAGKSGQRKWEERRPIMKKVEKGYRKYDECPIVREMNIVSMITAFRRVYDDNYYYRGESHDFWEILCVLDGTVSIAVESEVYELRKNQMIFFRPLEFHNMCSLNHTNPDILILSFRLSGPFELERQIVGIDDETVQELIGLLSFAKEVFQFDDIYVESVASGKKTEAQIFADRLEILLLSVIERGSAEAEHVITACTANYAKIVQILKNNTDKCLTIGEIAELADMSRSNVKKTFSMFANQGVINYFNQLKMTEAKKLLRQGYTVGEAGRKLGYAEQNYFSVVFKKYTGYSPRKWLAREISFDTY